MVPVRATILVLMVQGVSPVRADPNPVRNVQKSSFGKRRTRIQNLRSVGKDVSMGQEF
jgi:hypothetical protein